MGGILKGIPLKKIGKAALGFGVILGLKVWLEVAAAKKEAKKKEAIEEALKAAEDVELRSKLSKPVRLLADSVSKTEMDDRARAQFIVDFVEREAKTLKAP